MDSRKSPRSSTRRFIPSSLLADTLGSTFSAPLRPCLFYAGARLLKFDLMHRLLSFVIVLSCAAQPALNPLHDVKCRSIGPFRGGRVTAVAGVASDPQTYYFGATGGGIW